MRIATVIAFVQFTNALEYMVFNPIFVFMATDFAVPVSFSGYVSGMYTLGAVLSGIIAFYWIDHFNKKRFLIINMALLGLLTFLTTCTSSFSFLLALRFCAGLVGGTTMGVGISILINNAPPNLRGNMLATVIASFSIVSIVGMPTILFLCTHYGWHVALWLLFEQTVIGMVQKYDINPSRLILEITENIALNNCASMIEKMNFLSRHGIQLSLDDFGTGYSSLSYLQKMPMSQIKIDRSFVQAALDDKRSNKLVTGIIKIGLDLNLRVLVEGIETTEQFNAFKSNGCTEFQGYLWGCPMPLNDFIKQLPYFHK